MMPDDSAERADESAATFHGLQSVHAWDHDRRLGDLYAKTLDLHSTAWDVYLLYGPGVRWEASVPPQPAFWMHQLPSSTGADRTLVLYPTRLCQELAKLLEDRVDPSNFVPVDLGLRLHVKALAGLMEDQDNNTIEEISQAIENTKIGA